MQSASKSISTFKRYPGVLVAAVLLGSCGVNHSVTDSPARLSGVSLSGLSSLPSTVSSALATTEPRQLSASKLGDAGLDAQSKPTADAARTKTEGLQGEVVGEPVDCDGDGVVDEARIDFDGDGASDECVEGVEAIPEPPFQQTYTPTSEAFNSLLPAVGGDTQYQCGDGL